MLCWQQQRFGFIYLMLFVQVAFKNQKIKPAGERSVQEALDLLKDTYASAGERDIMTGDSVEFMVRHSVSFILHPLVCLSHCLALCCASREELLFPLNRSFSLRSLPLLV
jgi:hypothetical protein